MKKLKIEVEVSEDDLRHIRAVINGSDGEVCTHGTLDMNGLVQMLLEDVSLSVRRPGSWEGANMLRLLEAHGYDNTRFEFEDI